MKLCVKAGIVIAALTIELVLANILGMNTIKPDLVFLVVICLAYIFGAEEGVLVGFTGGLLKDIFSVHFLGINALAQTIIGYITGIIKERIFYQHLMWVVAISAFVFTFVNNLIIYFILNALYSNYDFVIVLKNFALTQAIMNSILAPFVYIGIKKIFSYLHQ